MAADHQITLDDEAYKALRLLVENRLARMQTNLAAYVEYVIVYERILAALEASTKVASTATVETSARTKPVAATKAAPRATLVESRPRKKRGEKDLSLPNLCEEHPKYGARRSPRTDCTGCWAAYEKYNGKSQADMARRAFDRKSRGGEEDDSYPSGQATSGGARHNRQDVEGIAETLPKGRNTGSQRTGAPRKS